MIYRYRANIHEGHSHPPLKPSSEHDAIKKKQSPLLSRLTNVSEITDKVPTVRITTSERTPSYHLASQHNYVSATHDYGDNEQNVVFEHNNWSVYLPAQLQPLFHSLVNALRYVYYLGRSNSLAPVVN